MVQLIKKDVAFNLKWALLLVLIAVVMPVVFYIDRGETRLILWVYVIGNVLANSHFVSKSCYLDDGAQTRKFLASLPVTRAQLVASKYLLGLLCAVISIALTSLSSFALGLRPSVQGALIAATYLLLYYSIFLSVFFRFNYSSAEKANTSLMMLTVMSVFILDRSGIHLDGMTIDPAVLIAGLGTAALIYAASLFMSINVKWGRFSFHISRTE